jgi:predicted  nucleic acid-binding Zn-ribbon protein
MTTAKDLKSALQNELAALTTTRDELRLKAHLAKADAKSELDRLEKTWERVQEQAQRIHAKDVVEEIESGVRGLIEELKSGYERIKREL